MKTITPNIIERREEYKTEYIQPGLSTISIIIVTRNVAKDLQRCLDSLFSQPYPFLEIIVIDGASTDGTVEILEKNDRKISYWKSENDKGIYDAMNKGIKQVTSDWVYFLGADDILLPDFSKMAMELKNKDTIYYGSVFIGSKKYLGFLSRYRQAKMGICHQAMFYPKAVFEKYSFNTKYKISADHVLNMQCAADPEIKIEFKDYIIANFSNTGVSSNFKDKVFEKEKASLIFKYFGFLIGLRFMFRKFKAFLFNREV